jgi:hypothetical protein
MNLKSNQGRPVSDVDRVFCRTPLLKYIHANFKFDFKFAWLYIVLLSRPMKGQTDIVSLNELKSKIDYRLFS